MKSREGPEGNNQAWKGSKRKATRDELVTERRKMKERKEKEEEKESNEEEEGTREK